LRCPRCGQDNVPGSIYCRHCGRKLPKKALDAKPEPASSAKSLGKRRRIHWGRLAGLTALTAVIAGVGFTTYETVKALDTMPSLSNLVSLSTAGQDSVIYDRFGQPVATLHLAINRIDVPLSQISPNVQNALIAVEDHNFWTNEGFDLRSILRAAYVDLLHRGALQGASTITEQLAKMLYLHDNRSLTYKIQEIVLGLELARSYSKQQILDMYFNQVYLGDGAYGIETAAKAYFNEKPSQLTIPQAALLAGLPQAPSAYDPLTNYQAAKARQLEVLQAMAKYGYIKPSQVQSYYRAPLHLRPQNIATDNLSSPYPYPWYIQQVIAVLRQKGFTPTEIYDGGLKIYTELDPTVYNIAQRAVDQWMNYNFGSNPAYQAAVVVEDPETGAIWAVIGGRSYQGADLNDLALTASRSSGSSIKPLMEYTEAIMQGDTQMTVIQDVPTLKVNGQWWPHNDDGIYRGYITLRDALAISDNDASVHLLQQVGPQNGLRFADQKFGLNLPMVDANYLGVAIGGFAKGGVNPYEMTQAYATFPNNGVRMKPIWVSKVVDSSGAVVYQQAPQGVRIFSPQVAFIMDTMMERVLDPHEIPGIGPGAYATGYDLGIGRPAAGKTGTNNGEKDAWFIGYEPQMVVGVWEGNQHGEYNQPDTPNGPAYGDVAAGPIWRQIMEQVNQAEHIPVENFTPPSGVVYVPNISITSGMLASSLTPKSDIEGAWFIQGTQPTTTGHNHVLVKVVASDPNELWKPGCGPAISKVFLLPETNWHPGVPLPWDAIFWPPTKTCTPAVNPSPSPSPSPSSSSPSPSPSSSSPSPSPSSPPKPGGPSPAAPVTLAPPIPRQHPAPPLHAHPGNQ
jgi:penicillin-binding protein 1A